MQQEKQLSDVFDCLPDKVLITTQASEAQAPRSVYSNTHINNFFGCDVVSDDKANQMMKQNQTSQNGKTQTRKPVRRKNKSAINRKVFRQYNFAH